jgi:hypothetical protein
VEVHAKDARPVVEIEQLQGLSSYDFIFYADFFERPSWAGSSIHLPSHLISPLPTILPHDGNDKARACGHYAQDREQPPITNTTNSRLSKERA